MQGSTKLIGCKVVVDALRPYLSEGLEVEVLDAGLHVRPGELTAALQHAIDNASGSYENLVLAYGLCSGAVVGLRATGCRLLVPLADDCIAFFLGSAQVYHQLQERMPGTYFLSRAWVEAGITPFAEFEAMAEKWGEVRAERLLRATFRHYRRILFVRTGPGEEESRRFGRRMAERVGLAYEETEGSSRFLEALAGGGRGGDFLAVEEGGTVELSSFLGYREREKER